MRFWMSYPLKEARALYGSQIDNSFIQIIYKLILDENLKTEIEKNGVYSYSSTPFVTVMKHAQHTPYKIIYYKLPTNITF